MVQNLAVNIQQVSESSNRIRLKTVRYSSKLYINKDRKSMAIDIYI